MNLRQVASDALSYLINDGMWRALKHRDYALFAAVSWFSTVGLWVQRLGIQWLTWQLTHSFAWLGAMALIEAVGGTLVMPLGGALADRMDRLLIARLAQGASTVIAATMAAVTMTGHMTIEMLIVLMTLNGLVDGFWTPTRLALVPSMVPRQDLAAAIGFGSVLFNLSQFVGPALAGVLIASFGVGSTFALNAISYVGTFIVLFHITLREIAPPSERTSRPTLFGGFVDGLKYALGHRALGPMIVLSTCVSMLLRPYRELLAGYADGIFHRGIEGLSLLASVSGGCAAVAAIGIANFARTKGLTRIVLGCMLANAVLLLAFASTSSFTFAVLLSGAMSALLTVIGISSQILVQSSVPDHMRGRVMSIWGIQFRGLLPLGAWATGIAAGAIGFHYALYVAAVGFILCWLAIFPRRREIATLEHPQPAE